MENRVINFKFAFHQVKSVSERMRFYLANKHLQKYWTTKHEATLQNSPDQR